MRLLLGFLPVVTATSLLLCGPSARAQESSNSSLPLPGDNELLQLKAEVAKTNASLRDISEKLDKLIQATKMGSARNAEQLQELRKEIAHMTGQPATAPSSSPDPTEAPVAAPVASATSPAAAGAPATAGSPDTDGIRHTVQKGENLTVIAKQYGVTIDEITKANKILDARKLQVGQELLIPHPASNPPKAQ